MSGKILGIDINEDFVTAVQVVSGLKGFQVLSCQSVMVDKNHGPSDALKDLSEKMDLKSGTYIASINGSDISYQNLVMPFKDPKKIKQTLPFEMETLVPFPVDDLVIDFNIVNISNQSEILAVSARKSLISEYLETLKPLGISPALIDIRPVPVTLWLLSQLGTPDTGVVIDIGLNKFTVVIFLGRRIALIRNASLPDETISASAVENMNAPSKEKMETVSGSLHFFIKSTLRSFSMQMKKVINPEKAYITGMRSQYRGIADILSRHLEIPVEKIEMRRDKGISMDYSIETKWNPALMDGALSLAVREIKKGHGFNLRKGEFEIKRNLLKTIKELRMAGVAVLIILIFLMIDLCADYYLVKKRYEVAAQRCADLFRQSFPDSADVKYPLLQMKQKIEELKKSNIILPGDINKGEKVLDLFNDISQRLPETLDIDVENMVIDTETVRISGETDSFNTINSMESGLESSPYFSDVTINKAEHGRTGEKVEFELKLQRK
jgi:general secretion pathway protein L